MKPGSLSPADVASVACLAAVAALLALSDYPDRGQAFTPLPDDEVVGDEPRAARYSEVASAVGFLREEYAFQARLDPVRMLLAALHAITEEFDWVLVSPPAADEEAAGSAPAALPDSVTVQMRAASRTFDVSRVGDLYQAAWKLMEILDSFPLDKETSVKMEDAAIIGMLSVLDPHTAYMNEAEYNEMKMSTRGAFGGIGIVISVRDGELRVMSVMPGTPAFRKRIHKGDRIVQIDDESTINMTVNEAAGKLRGEPGTEVTVWVRGADSAAGQPVTLVREQIRVVSVLGRNLDGRTAYLRVKGFQQGTSAEVRQFLERTYSDRPPSGVVLDLRGNSGGVMSAAVELADLFLAGGNIVTTVARAVGESETETATAGEPFEDAAVVLLVDHGSASASEIVTAALKHNDRALVLGERTFGKGSVQYVQPLHRGALKLTVSQYVGPDMDVIQGAGIEPHVQLGAIRTASPVRFPTFAQEFEGESALPYHLEKTSESVPYDPPAFCLRYVPDSAEPQADEYDSVTVDYPVLLALDILSSCPSVRGSQMLDQCLERLVEHAEMEEFRLDGLAADEGKSWSPGPLPAAATVEVAAVAEPARVAAGQDGLVQVTVTNTGSATAPGLYCRTESEDAKLDGKSCLIGDVPPGGAASCEIKFKAQAASPHRMDRVFVDVLQDTDETVASTSFLVETLPAGRPRLAMTYVVDDPTGNRDGAVQPGETFDVVMTVTNVGDGVLEKGLAIAENVSGAALFLASGRSDLVDLAPGSSATVRFSLRCQKEAQDGRLAVLLGVIDVKARTKFFATRLLPAARPDDGALAPAAVEPLVRIISVEPPDLLGPADTLSVAGEADFGTYAPVEQAGLAVYDNGRKVAMLYLGERTASARLVPFRFEVPLSPGSNRVVVTAFRKNQSQGYATLYYNKVDSSAGMK